MPHPSLAARHPAPARFAPREWDVFDQLLPRYRPGVSALDWDAVPPRERRTRMEHWLYDHGPRVALNQAIARQALSLITVLPRSAGAREDTGPLPMLLDQFYAASEHVWYRWHARHVAFHHARALQRMGIAYCAFGTVVVPHRWFVPAAEFDAAEIARKLPEWRDQAQRWARRLPTGSLCIGMIEADLLDDQKTGTRGWAFHLTLLIYVPCRSIAHGRRIIRKAFPLKRRPELGILRPVVSRAILHSRGGPRGWLRYAGKALQIHGVKRRYVPYDTESDQRGSADPRHLDHKELVQWTGLLQLISADDLMVWSGYSRRGDSVHPTPKLRAALGLHAVPIHRARDLL